MKKPPIIVALLLATAPVKLASGAELESETIAAWDAYVAAARSRMDARLNGQTPFLWAEDSKKRMVALHKSGIIAEPSASNGRTAVPGGLIHHWIGAVFIPAVTSKEVWARLDQYDDYKKIYQPSVVDSKLIAREGNRRRYSMTFDKRTAVVSVVMKADYESTFAQPAPDRWWSVSQTTNIQEFKHYGQPGEALLPAGTGSSFVWRLCSFMRVKDTEGGAYVEIETLVLSREIPGGFGWLVGPILNRVSRNSMLSTLNQTKAALAR